MFNGINNQRIFDEVKSDKKATGKCIVEKKVFVAEVLFLTVIILVLRFLSK